jgi:hypothetical protein
MTAGRVAVRVLLAALAAALVAGVARALGLDGPHALTLGWGVLAAGLVLSARPVVADAEPPPTEADPPAGRRDVDQLAWSMVEHRTHVRGIVLARVRRLTALRLAAHGLDADRPADAAAIEALLGPPAWAVLRPDRERPVVPRDLDAALQALERLDPPGPSGAAPLPDLNRTTRAR